MTSKPYAFAVLARASINPLGRRTGRPHGRPPQFRTVALAAALVAALFAGCGGDSEATNGGASREPATPVERTAATGNETDSQPDLEPTTEAMPQPEPDPEPEYEATPPYDPAPEPQAAVEPESDASRWVDRRQNEVLNEVNQNNMDATNNWTP
jgi:hypothetical protein